jgi:hypothetical protein
MEKIKIFLIPFILTFLTFVLGSLNANPNPILESWHPQNQAATPAVNREANSIQEPLQKKRELIESLKSENLNYNGLTVGWSREHRPELWRASYRFLKSDIKFILVGGSHSFNKYLVENNLMPEQLLSDALGYSHNFYLSTLINGGLGFSALIFFIFIYPFCSLFSKNAGMKGKLLFFAMAEIFLIGLVSGFDFSGIRMVFNGLIFLIIAIHLLDQSVIAVEIKKRGAISDFF